MEFNGLNKMVGWERTKALFLISTVQDLGMNLDSDGIVGVNESSGYTYIWLEDYNFTLYMPIDCGLTKQHVWVMYSCPYDGEETEVPLNNLALFQIEEWAGVQSELSREKEVA